MFLHTKVITNSFGKGHPTNSSGPEHRREQGVTSEASFEAAEEEAVHRDVGEKIAEGVKKISKEEIADEFEGEIDVHVGGKPHISKEQGESKE